LSLALGAGLVLGGALELVFGACLLAALGGLAIAFRLVRIDAAPSRARTPADAG
jgi:hypothetical protein